MSDMTLPPYDDGFSAVLALSEEHPGSRWLKVVRAAHTVSRRVDGQPMAGRWVLKELHQMGDSEWRPGLRVLERFGILRKVGESTRSGNRAYYVMPDPVGVDKGLRRLGY